MRCSFGQVVDTAENQQLVRMRIESKTDFAAVRHGDMLRIGQLSRGQDLHKTLVSVGFTVDLFDGLLRALCSRLKNKKKTAAGFDFRRLFRFKA